MAIDPGFSLGRLWKGGPGTAHPLGERLQLIRTKHGAGLERREPFAEMEEEPIARGAPMRMSPPSSPTR